MILRRIWLGRFLRGGRTISSARVFGIMKSSKNEGQDFFDLSSWGITGHLGSEKPAFERFHEMNALLFYLLEPLLCELPYVITLYIRTPSSHPSPSKILPPGRSRLRNPFHLQSSFATSITPTLTSAIALVLDLRSNPSYRCFQILLPPLRLLLRSLLRVVRRRRIPCPDETTNRAYYASCIHKTQVVRKLGFGDGGGIFGRSGDTRI